MFQLFVVVFAPAAIGLVAGTVLALVARRVATEEFRSVRVVAGVAAAFVLAVQLFVIRWAAWPWSIPDWILEDALRVRFGLLLLPLVLSIPLVVATAWAPRPLAGGVAALARRGILTLIRPWMLVTLALLLVVAVALALAGGFASSPDEEGRHTRFVVELTRDTGASTTIYGWFFSIPSLGLSAALATIVVIALALLAARPLGADPEGELARRRSRARSVLAAGGGALLLHLGAVLGMFSATASLTATFSAGELGMVDLVGPFAALGPALRVAAEVTGALGYTLWWFVLLAAIIPSRRAPAS